LPTINKSYLAKILAEKKDLNGTQAKNLVDAFFQTMIESIIQGNRIEARGFGVFEVKKTNAKRIQKPGSRYLSLQGGR